MSQREAAADWAAQRAPRWRPEVDPLLAAAGVALLLLLLAALLGERLAPHEPIYFVVEHERDPRPFEPGVVFPLGSDILGRDLFSVALAGARATLTIVVLSGVARVVAGALIAMLGTWWRPARIGTEWLAEFASAVPATLVALIVVKVLVRSDTTLLTFIGALLLTGWAGPYRVIRSDLDRLANMGFTQGAHALGATRWRLFWRHHIPHLLPVVAFNTSQQIVASLVLVAELGVLGAALGFTRNINIAESMRFPSPAQVNSALVADPPEWGGLLASARTIESLWTTRWLVLVPAVAFALTAGAVALIGFALARRYARRDVIADLRSRGAAGLLVALLAVFLVSSLVPERYAEAREWAAAARAELQPTDDIERAFIEAGLEPVGASYAVTRELTSIVQAGPASVSAAGVRITEPFPHSMTDASDRGRTSRSFVSARFAGGIVEAPLVFAGRGISAADYVPSPQPLFQPRVEDFAGLIRDYDYADDYAGIDVRGKVVLLARFIGFKAAQTGANAFRNVVGPQPDDAIANAVKRGAAAVIFIDPALYLYNDVQGCCTYGLGDLIGGQNPYLRGERNDPPKTTSGVPVFVLGDLAAQEFMAPFGIDITPFFRADERRAPQYQRSLSRDLGVIARVEVPMERRTAAVTSHVAQVKGAPADAARVVVWNIRRPGVQHPGEEVLAAVARSVAARGVPMVFVNFDPDLDPVANAKTIEEALKGQRIGLVIVLDHLDGPSLRFTTPHGDLIPALDLYADKAGARHEVTRATASEAALAEVAPFFGIKTVLIDGSRGDGDARPEAAALVGYLAGRLALGAEELPR